MRLVTSFKEFLDEYDKGVKRVAITKDFYDWLKTDRMIDPVDAKHGDSLGSVYGVAIYAEEWDKDEAIRK